MESLPEAVRRSRSASTRETFERRVDEQADWLRERIEAGDLDAGSFALGLELEAYAVDADGRLATIPVSVFEAGPNKELGLHNVEVNTDPDVFDAAGASAQAAAIRDGVETARSALSAVDRRLVLDAMWTVPPAEGSLEYLTAVSRHDDVFVAENARPNGRYCALDNDILSQTAAGRLTYAVPGARHELPTLLIESLTTSIQPHLQIPRVDRLPDYYNAAIRTLGPVLALSTNSPFLPADAYNRVDDPADLVETTYHELRVPTFEQSVNAGDWQKARFPRDLAAPTDVVERVREDWTAVPFLYEHVSDEPRESFREQFWEFDHKRGTYWRWLRAVIGGQAVGDDDGRTIRLEYRPLPTQPSVPDVVGLQLLVAGLVRGLVAAEHPIAELPWKRARETFYGVVEDGLDATLHWVTADGEHTTDPDAVFADLFEHARLGLAEAGLNPDAVDDRLAPIERRWTEGTVPSRWKKARVRAALADGADLEAAIVSTQSAYVERAGTGTPFVDWD